MALKIVFIHFHLKTGGVTTVIKQQIKAIQSDCKILVLVGEPVIDAIDFEALCIPGIGYDSTDGFQNTPEEISQAVITAIYNKWPQGCDLIHVHNATLAKNSQFLKILKSLQKQNLRIFIQIHDFAEDGRPHAYYHTDEYPVDCHYGVINSRDFTILRKAGLNPKGLHLIPNTITPIPMDADTVYQDIGAVYPVRGLRRKNIGEAVLLSLFLPQDCPIDITLPPNSQSDLTAFDDWQLFAKKNHLNIKFGRGQYLVFKNIVHSAKFLLTTSITEGFGFSFLEPWSALKFLWGRNIPSITQDFENKGISLSHLYTRLKIPIKWLVPLQFEEIWLNTYENACQLFDHKKDMVQIKSDFQRIVENNTVDFGILDEYLQKSIILMLQNNVDIKKDLIKQNPFLSSLHRLDLNKQLIAKNHQAVLNNYNEHIYKKTLLDIYDKTINYKVSHRISKSMLVEAFVTPQEFSLLKWNEYVQGREQLK